MHKLQTTIGPITLENPVLCASGCFGHGYEASHLTDVSKIGAVSLKSVTPEARLGNPTPRIHEVPGGIMSSIGLQNPGFEGYMESIYPRACEVLRPDQRFISIAGGSADDYIGLARKLGERIAPGEIAALEVNCACPNVSLGGGSFSRFPDKLVAMVKEVIKAVPFPVVAKISTVYDNFLDAARAAEDSGAVAIYTNTTPLAMAIDIERGMPFLGNQRGPICGPSIRPLGVLRTWEVYKVVKVPLIPSGGIASWQDALEYMMAGASAVSIGTANFVNPNTAVEVAEGLAAYVEAQGLGHISEVVGLAQRNWDAKVAKR